MKIKHNMQKFFSQPTTQTLSDGIMYEIVRRNETTGELEPIGFQNPDEQITKLIASNLNQEYLEGCKN